MHALLSPKNLAIAGLGAAVIGLGTVVAVDHLASAAPAARSASLSASTRTSSWLAAGDLAAMGQPKNEASRVFGFLTTDTKLTWEQIAADALRGETLDQIAGANAAKVERDALAEVKAGLEVAVARGAITPAEEARLAADARDAISVLMAAKLSALLPSGR
jgi:hypothetical protein